MEQLVKLYVDRSYHIWKESDIVPWFEKNVHEVLDRVDKREPIVLDYESKRSKRYTGFLPRSICRHIILSDCKDIAPLPEDFSGCVFGFDPLPPTDSINIYTRPKKSKPAPSSSNPVGLFFQSLFPNYNINENANNLYARYGFINMFEIIKTFDFVIINNIYRILFDIISNLLPLTLSTVNFAEMMPFQQLMKLQESLWMQFMKQNKK